MYQTYSDSAIKIDLKNDDIYFMMQLLDKRANGEKMETLFHDFVSMMKGVFHN